MLDGSRRKAWFALLLGVLAASSASILVRASDAPPMTLAALRLLLAFLLLSPAAFLRHRSALARWSGGMWLLSGASGVFLAIHFAAWFLSLGMLPVAVSTVLVSTHPFLVLPLATRLFGERLGRPAWAGVMLAVAGVAIIAGPEAGTAAADWRGHLMALIGAAAIAGYLLCGRQVRKRTPTLLYSTVAYGIAGLVLLAAEVGQGLLPAANRAWGTLLTDISPGAWLAAFLLAVGPTVIGHTSFNYALGILGASAVSLAVVGEPAGAAVLAFFLLGESPSCGELAGLACIVAGTAVFSASVRAEGEAAK